LEDIKYYLWLNLRLGAGSRAAVRLVRVAGNARRVYENLSEDLAKEAKVKPSVIDKLRRGRSLTECEEIISKCEKWNVEILTPDMEKYPKSLLCTMDYPMVLFCRGKLPDFNKLFFCAVVGTRNMTDYGRRAAYNIGLGLGDGGAVTVSGLALGIDGMAMAGALAAGGVTVGVLGCGIDVVYPSAHKELFEMVMENGAIITEYIPGTRPAGSNFPVRNRIISGLCQATAVIEADISSGALITAKHAIFQGREVFALPGNVGEKNSEGPNTLIRDGASALLDANDIISKYEFLYPHSLKPARVMQGGADTSEMALAHVGTGSAVKKKSYGAGIFGGGEKSSLFKGKKGKNSSASTPSPAPQAENVPSYRAPASIKYAPPAIRTTAQTPEAVSAAESAAADKTARIKFCHIDTMGKKEQEIYYAMKPGTPTLPEEILRDKYSIGEVVAAMTLLEIAGAVEAGAGGYYIRCDSPDDGFVSENE